MEPGVVFERERPCRWALVAPPPAFTEPDKAVTVAWSSRSRRLDRIAGGAQF